MTKLKLRLSVRKAEDCPGYYVYGGGRCLSLHRTSEDAYKAIQERTMRLRALAKKERKV